MTLPVSGPIRLGADVEVELGGTSTTQVSMGSSAFRDLYAIASGAIRLGADGYGKIYTFYHTIASDQANLDLYASAVAAGWNGTRYLVVTINSGVNVYASSTGNAGLIISGTYAHGLTINNYGAIWACGGTGAYGSGGDGAAGGDAISTTSAFTLNNQGYVLGGGGGGGAGLTTTNLAGNSYNAGGGGGGGAGYVGGAGGGNYVSTVGPVYINNGSGSGSTSGGGAGGILATGEPPDLLARGDGGAGGSFGAAGGTGSSSQVGSVPKNHYTYGGGAGGYAIRTNGNSVNITAGNNGSQIQGSVG
jgi:hypothetical protein